MHKEYVNLWPLVYKTGNDITGALTDKLESKNKRWIWSKWTRLHTAGVPSVSSQTHCCFCTQSWLTWSQSKEPSLVYEGKAARANTPAFWPRSVLKLIKLIRAVFSINFIVCLHSSSLACICLMLLWNVGYVIQPKLERDSTDVPFVRWECTRVHHFYF